MDNIILYGTPGSLYTGKARSYLIKAGIAYQELTSSGEHYQSKVKPLAATPSVPVIELSDGQVIRDGTRIIDHYEAQTNNGFSPLTPKQRIVSRLFDAIGSEGLLRPAMHYRWSFLEQNEDSVRYFFESMVPLSRDKKQGGEKVMTIMKGAGQAFGVMPENFELIETLYESYLDRLNAHFLAQPYLLGGKPCIGDFGLMAPMYAHLGRDPKPLQLMQSRALSVFRWVERMNRPNSDMGEFNETFTDSFSDQDEVPDTLIDLMAHLAIDFVPETIAAADCINEFLAKENPVSGTPIQRGVGFASFEIHGQAVNALAQPYRFYLLSRVQKIYEALDEVDRLDVDTMLSNSGLTDILNAKLDRDIIWENNRELWA